MSTLTREVVFLPAYDKRAEGYGQHCVDITFYVKGEHGAVQFRLFTGWYPDIIRRTDPEHEWVYHIRDMRPHDRPIAADLGYHSYVPMYPEHRQLTENCPILGGKPCYYDGSGLAADRLFFVLVNEGDAGVWRELEVYYQEVFAAQIAEGVKGR